MDSSIEGYIGKPIDEPWIYFEEKLRS